MLGSDPLIDDGANADPLACETPLTTVKALPGCSDVGKGKYAQSMSPVLRAEPWTEKGVKTYARSVAVDVDEPFWLVF